MQYRVRGERQEIKPTAGLAVPLPAVPYEDSIPGRVFYKGNFLSYVALVHLGFNTRGNKKIPVVQVTYTEGKINVRFIKYFAVVTARWYNLY